MQNAPVRWPQLVTAVGAALAIGGCRDNGNDHPGKSEGGSLYGVVSLVISDTGSTTYVNLVDSLDFSSIDLATGREFPGYAPVDAMGGKVFVASGESPTATRYSVTREGSWLEEGTVSFANYLSFGSAASAFLSASKAYVAMDVVDRIVWDPTSLTITGTASAHSAIPLERGGLKVNLAHDHALRGNRLFQPFYWADESYARYAPISQIQVYDTETDQAVALLDAPCPHLHIASRDDHGNLYFSNGSLSGTSPLLYEGDPKNCIVRVREGEQTVDEAFTVDFATLTGGREGAGFRYLGNGKGIFAAFHHERIEIAPDSDPTSVNFSANWRLWTVDLETKTAAPMEGMDYFAGQYLAFNLDGRTFILLPSAHYSSTATYEILSDGTAVRRLDSVGWAFHMFKVR